MSRRGDRVVITNRKARYDYFVLERYECGITRGSPLLKVPHQQSPDTLAPGGLGNGDLFDPGNWPIRVEGGMHEAKQVADNLCILCCDKQACMLVGKDG